MKVLKFYADWCGPCKMLSKIVEDQYTGNVPVEDINIDTNTEMAVKFGIRGVPTCVIVDDAGNEIRRRVGMMTINEFNMLVEG